MTFSLGRVEDISFQVFSSLLQLCRPLLILSLATRVFLGWRKAVHANWRLRHGEGLELMSAGQRELEKDERLCAEGRLFL